MDTCMGPVSNTRSDIKYLKYINYDHYEGKWLDSKHLSSTDPAPNTRSYIVEGAN